MLSVLLTIHLVACVALVIAVMLQRSEGGALGMSGGGTGGIISGRGAASVLVRTTMILAGVFFTTSIVMTRLNNEANTAPGTLERQIQQDGSGDPLGAGGLSGATPSTTTIPAVPAPAPVIDPLAPTTAPATAPVTTPPATTPTTTTTAPVPAPQSPPKPAPATPAPAPAPAENGGSNN